MSAPRADQRARQVPMIDGGLEQHVALRRASAQRGEPAFLMRSGSWLKLWDPGKNLRPDLALARPGGMCSEQG